MIQIKEYCKSLGIKEYSKKKKDKLFEMKKIYNNVKNI